MLAKTKIKMAKKKKSIGNTASSPIVIQEKGGSNGVVLPIIGIGALFAGYQFILKPYLAQLKENKAEGDTTPEAQVANQFKAVFGPKDHPNWVVSDSDYQAAALLLTDSNKKLVFEKYKALTDRNLSDDISKHESSDVQSKAAKIQQYNSKPGKLFSITPDGKIQFEVVKGDKIRFAPGQTTPVNFYSSSFGIVLNELNNPELNAKLAKDPKTAASTVKVSVKPSAALYTVISTKEIPYSGMAENSGFFKYVKPYVNVSKTFAAVQIGILSKKTGKPVLLWVDARDLMTFKKTAVKGMGTVNLAM